MSNFLTTTIFKSTNKIFCQYEYSIHWYKFYQRALGQNYYRKNYFQWFIICLSLSIIKLLMDLLMEKTCQKQLPASFRWYFHWWIWHITNRNTVCNSICDIFCLLVFPSMKFTYNQQQECMQFRWWWNSCSDICSNSFRTLCIYQRR